MPTFTREHNNGMYTVFAYFLGKNIAEYPIFVMIPIIWITIYYFMVGLWDNFSTFLFTLVVGIMVSTIAVSFGYFMSCMCAKTDIALSFCSPILAPLQLWGGFFLNSRSIPEYFRYARVLSWFYYGYKLLIVNQWEKVEKMKDLPGHTCANQSSTDPCFENGEEVIKFLDFAKPAVLHDLSILVIITLTFRFLSYYCLYMRIKFTR